MRMFAYIFPYLFSPDQKTNLGNHLNQYNPDKDKNLHFHYFCGKNSFVQSFTSCTA